MTTEFICGLMVVAGAVTLVVAALMLLGQFAETTRVRGGQDGDTPERGADDNHRLSLAIAEALLRHQFIDPQRVNEVAQVVALKIELQKAIGH